MIVDIPKNDGTTQKQIGSAFKFGGNRPIYKHVGAKLGEHNEEILTSFGYSVEQIAVLQEKGVLE